VFWTAFSNEKVFFGKSKCHFTQGRGGVKIGKKVSPII